MGKKRTTKKSHVKDASEGVSQLRALENDLLRVLTDEEQWGSGDERMNAALKETFQLLDALDRLRMRIEIRNDGTHVNTRASALGNFWEKADGAEESRRLARLHAFLDEPCMSGSCDAWEMRETNALDGKGRGVYAKRDLLKYEVAFQIPRSIMFSAMHGRAIEMRSSGNTGAVWDEHINSVLATMEDNTVVSLAMVLLHHTANGSASFFWPYINSLPREYDIPAFWPIEFFSAVEDVKTARKAKLNVRATAMLYMRCAKAVQAYAERMKKCGEEDTSSPWLYPGVGLLWKHFRWAMATVTTRQNQIPIGEFVSPPEKQQQALTLVPGWDMMNHRKGEMTTDFDTGNESIVFRTMEATRKGEEILMCYGTRRSDELLIYSGFVDETNKGDDLLLLDLSIPCAEGLAKMRKGIYKALTNVQLMDHIDTIEIALKMPASASMTAFASVATSISASVIGSAKGCDDGWHDCISTVLPTPSLSALIAVSINKDEVAMILRLSDKRPEHIYGLLCEASKRRLYHALRRSLESSLAKNEPQKQSIKIDTQSPPEPALLVSASHHSRWIPLARSCALLNEAHAAIKTAFNHVLDAL